MFSKSSEYAIRAAIYIAAKGNKDAKVGIVKYAIILLPLNFLPRRSYKFFPAIISSVHKKE